MEDKIINNFRVKKFINELIGIIVIGCIGLFFIWSAVMTIVPSIMEIFGL